MVSSPTLRKLWRKLHDEYDTRWLEYEERLEQHHEYVISRVIKGDYRAASLPNPEPPEYIPLPKVLHNLTCGAKTRAGTSCKRTDLYRSGRCKFHGGMSTGPRTKKGKKKVAKNGFKKQTP